MATQHESGLPLSERTIKLRVLIDDLNDALKDLDRHKVTGEDLICAKNHIAHANNAIYELTQERNASGGIPSIINPRSQVGH